MKSVMTQIRNWANTLPYWEQIALEKIVSGVVLGDVEYDEMLHYFLQDVNAEPMAQRPPLFFPMTSDSPESSTTPVILRQISSLQNINALIPGQTLTFCKGLTAIYGANGSGKSGYARVMGCAGFTRGDREILPDVTKPNKGGLELTADIQVLKGEEIHSISYKANGSCPLLECIYVFDSTSVRVHLTHECQLSFAPAGLEYLTQLAQVMDKLRDRLDAQIVDYSQPHCLELLFQGESEVTEFIKNLGPKTNLAKLRYLANISAEEEQSIQTLDLQIAHLKSQNIPESIKEINEQIGDLESLIANINSTKQALSDEYVYDISISIRHYLASKLSAQKVSIEQFRTTYFTQAGSTTWYEFVKAAKALAEAEQSVDDKYPQDNSRCLLCHQPLTGEARNLILSLWSFLESDAQSQLIQASAMLKKKREYLDAISLEFFSEDRVSNRLMRSLGDSLFGYVEVYTKSLSSRRSSILSALDNTNASIELAPLPDDPTPKIRHVITSLVASRLELESKDPTTEINNLELQIRLLRHRVILRDLVEQIESYVSKCVWVEHAKASRINTSHVTKKYNDIFKELVAERYIQLFEQIVTDLGRPLQVKIITRGKKGELYKQIGIITDSTIIGDELRVDKILSEGEKRAVALADFLTEVALDTSSGAIILDDPVTSLDLEWRNRVANLLVQQAKQRQVIVFTHDLPFLYYLKNFSEKENIEQTSHWIKRGDADNKPGYVFLNNSPALEKEYKKATHARDLYVKAQNAPPETQEMLLKAGFGALRTSYEALIIFELFNGVVERFEERISFGRLTEIVWNPEIVQTVVTKCELLSRYIEGHLHSDNFVAEKSTPRVLLSEIEIYENLCKKIQELKNKIR